MKENPKRKSEKKNSENKEERINSLLIQVVKFKGLVMNQICWRDMALRERGPKLGLDSIWQWMKNEREQLTYVWKGISH